MRISAHHLAQVALVERAWWRSIGATGALKPVAHWVLRDVTFDKDR